jgi:hypothetical protein|tara:strand:+ start:554 stop:784 length:231 start_codon:yes stop_codon:yes gene_type:complete
MAKTIKPDFNMANAINPAIADVRDERASQERKMLRMEALKTAAGLAVSGGDVDTKVVIDAANNIYNYLENGTTMVK